MPKRGNPYLCTYLGGTKALFCYVNLQDKTPICHFSNVSLFISCSPKNSLARQMVTCSFTAICDIINSRSSHKQWEDLVLFFHCRPFLPLKRALQKLSSTKLQINRFLIKTRKVSSCLFCHPGTKLKEGIEVAHSSTLKILPLRRTRMVVKCTSAG